MTEPAETHPVLLPDEKLLEQCDVQRTRHSGPGGQHRNKVETAIQITHRPSGIVAFAAEQRSQEANRRVAVQRLRVLLAIRLRSVMSPEVLPSELWSRRCRGQKIVCSMEHRDFAAMLCEAIDAVVAKEWDVRRASAALGCSSTQLIRFLARMPEALESVNQSREAHGLRRLHA